MESNNDDTHLHLHLQEYSDDVQSLRRALQLMEVRTLEHKRRADAAEKENRLLRAENQQLAGFSVHNAMTVPDWARHEEHGGGISPSAALALVNSGAIDAVRVGKIYLVLLTGKTKRYRRSNRGPKPRQAQDPS